MTAPAELTVVARAVEKRLQRFLFEEEERWVSVDQALGEQFAVLRSYILSRGKRLRPAFCYWSFLGAGGDAENPVVIDAAASLEMFHAAALIHDDIIDRSELRHGSPAAHVQLSDLHRQKSWRGDPDLFGQGTAIVAGDMAFVYSNRLLAAASLAARQVFEEMQVEVNVGQSLDIIGAAQGLGTPTDEERARKIRYYKTAKYTVERPMHLGVALADPSRLAAFQPVISEFALPLGDAFQLTDDLLGAFGDPAVTGKPAGDDLSQGKVTLLAALAARERFSGADAGDAAEAIERLERSGARSGVERLIGTLLGQAESARRRLPFSEPALGALGELAAYVGARDR
jgi:geranylgeranyl diphosphate synthase type I